MKNKFLVSLLAVITAVGLTACSFLEPTPEELINGSFSTEQNAETADMDILIDLAMEIPVEDMSMDMEMKMDLNCKAEKEITHVKGEIGAEIFGMNFDMGMESWTDGEYTYNYDEENELWTKEDAGDVETFNFTGMDVEMFTDLVLEEVTKDSTEYVVTGKVSYAKMVETLDMDLADLMEGDVDSDVFENASFNARLTFDKKTKAFKTVTFDIDKESLSNELKLDTFTVTLTMNSIGETLNLEIPQKVKDEAVLAEDLPTEEMDLFEDDTNEIYDYQEELYDDEFYADGDYEYVYICQELFGVDFAHEEEFAQIFGDKVEYESLVGKEIMDVLNFETYDDVYEYLAYDYEKELISTEKKEALGWLIEYEILDKNELIRNGVDKEAIDEWTSKVTK